MSTKRSPRVAIFRTDWLPHSETFIVTQMRTLSRWDPQPVGVGRVELNSIAPSDVRIAWPKVKHDSKRRRILQATRRSSALKNAIREARVGLVHSHFGPAGVLMQPITKQLDLPHIVTFHGVDTAKLYREQSIWGHLYRLRLSQLFTSKTTLLAVSESIKRQLVEIGCDEDRVRVHYNGTVVDDSDPNCRDVRAGFLFVGRLVEKKGVDVLIDAVADLANAGHVVHLTVVGDGPLREPLELRSREVAPTVDFAGSLPHREVLALMKKSIALVVPSVTTADGDIEGLPTVLPEAMAKSTPVIATRHAGNEEIVDDQRNGLLVRENDVSGLASALLRMQEDDLTWQEFSARARETVVARFDAVRQGTVLEAIYDATVLEHGRGLSSSE